MRDDTRYIPELNKLALTARQVNTFLGTKILEAGMKLQASSWDGGKDSRSWVLTDRSLWGGGDSRHIPNHLRSKYSDQRGQWLIRGSWLLGFSVVGTSAAMGPCRQNTAITRTVKLDAIGGLSGTGITCSLYSHDIRIESMRIENWETYYGCCPTFESPHIQTKVLPSWVNVAVSCFTVFTKVSLAWPALLQ